MKEFLLLFIAIPIFMFSCKNARQDEIQNVVFAYDTVELQDSIQGYSYHTATYMRRNSQFKTYSVRGKIVWIGDSLSDEIELNELFGRSDIANRGIGMDIIQGVKERIGGYVSDSPKQVVLWIGVNNLRYFSQTNPTQVFFEISNLVKEIKAHDIPVIVICPLKHSTMEEFKGFEPNFKIDTLHHFLDSAHRVDGYYYINPNDSLSLNGYMKSQYTNDGIHLLSPAINIIKNMVAPHLKN